MVAVPWSKPLTTPKELTEATDGEPLYQVPPTGRAVVNCIVELAHTFAGPPRVPTFPVGLTVRLKDAMEPKPQVPAGTV